MLREGRGRTHVLLALVIWPLTTHPFREGVPFLLLIETRPTFGRSLRFFPYIAYMYVYILLSPDAERPPSRLLARSGARYEISDLREIYGVGRRNSAGSSGGCSSGGEPQSAPFYRRVRRALAPRMFSGNPRRSLFGGWALPERNVFGGRIGSKIQAGRTTACCNLFSVRQHPGLYNANKLVYTE